MAIMERGGTGGAVPGRPRTALHYAAASDPGCEAENNADSAYAGPHLIAVSDGTAGRRAGRSVRGAIWAGPDLTGELASSRVIASMSELDKQTPFDALEGRLRTAVAQANTGILDVRTGRPESGPAGATLTALLWSGSRFALVHIGDSRGYLLREGELFQITHDHTHPSRGVYRLLDGGADGEPDLRHREALLGDRYLLATDGLTDVVDAPAIYEVLDNERSPAGAVQRLIQLAIERGGPDNISCAITDAVESPVLDAAPFYVGAIALGPRAGQGARPQNAPAATTPAEQSPLPPPKIFPRGDETVPAPPWAAGSLVGEELGPDDPRQVAGYRILRKLGHGGMGRVYLARSRGGRRVAVKMILPSFTEEPGFRDRFAREAEAARAISGVFTAPVLDADPRGDPPWLVTGYVPGPSLREAVLAFGALPPRTLDMLAAGLAEALLAIHGAGLVHRDLKPSNILLATDGPRVIDFGIVRAAVGDSGGLTETGAVIGTPEYMSPEQIAGHRVDAASDVFSLGAVLVFAATGRAPFGRGPSHTIGYRIVHTEPDLSRVPAALHPLFVECLAKDPRRRPTPGRVLQLLESRISLHSESDEPWLPPQLR